MSNFEDSEEWRDRIKKFLMLKKNVSISPEKDLCASPSPTFDLDKDFRKILKEKCPMVKLSFGKENYKPEGIESTKPIFGHGINSISKRQSLFETTANDSFFYLEQICDKSVSDPDSTIHSYVENMRKKSSFNTTNNTTKGDEENAAIERLLNECDMNAHSNECHIPERTIYHDQTQLDDIEAPSGIWETTISDANLLEMSPTKRVGLLRPSTIIEEANFSYSDSENSKNNSSVLSFKTAQKSNETTSYETANDTVRSENVQNNQNVQKYIFEKYNKSYNTEYSGEDSAFSNTTSSIEKNKTDSLDSEKFNSKNTLDDVSSILDDSLYSGKKNIAKNTSNDFAAKDSYIEISDEDDSNCEGDSLNEGFSIQSIDDNSDDLNETLNDSSNDLNVSHVFNDTLEEVDYILKKGMKMIHNSGAQPITIQSINGNPPKLNIYTPSPKNKSPKTPNTVISKQFSNLKNPSSMINKKELFKKPAYPSGCRIPQPKSLLNVKKSDPYANIISPVRAYIKNTPKTPIVSNIRETTVPSLDYDQVRKLQPKQHQFLQDNYKGGTSSLPKKAYQSANYVDIRDERSPLNIPGGQKIHKYLQPAFLPTVVRHEGKMKMMKSSSIDDNLPIVNTTIDSSLADLSVMSGDVSVYTVRDAHNFDQK